MEEHMKYAPTPPTPARGHMPFPDHRSQAEVRQDEEAGASLRKLSMAARV
jgi:hypothetical protein